MLPQMLHGLKSNSCPVKKEKWKLISYVKALKKHWDGESEKIKDPFAKKGIVFT